MWTGKVSSNDKNDKIKGKVWSTNTIVVDQEVVVKTDNIFGHTNLSWWIIALIVAGVFAIFSLILITLYMCGFFRRNNQIVYRKC